MRLMRRSTSAGSWTSRYGTPGLILLKDATGDATVSWYLTYKITNKTDKDVPLNLKIKGETDTNKTYRDTIDPLAHKALEKKTKKKYKHALAMTRGTIPAGKSIEAVAFFGNIDANWDDLFVHISGLVDTIDRVKGKLFFEKKVLVVHYNRPGDEFDSADDPITLKGDKWILDGERTEIKQKPKE